MNTHDEKKILNLKKLYTGAVTDILDSLGEEFRNQTLPNDLRPIE